MWKKTLFLFSSTILFFCGIMYQHITYIYHTNSLQSGIKNLKILKRKKYPYSIPLSIILWSEGGIDVITYTTLRNSGCYIRSTFMWCLRNLSKLNGKQKFSTTNLIHEQTFKNGFFERKVFCLLFLFFFYICKYIILKS